MFDMFVNFLLKDMTFRDRDLNPDRQITSTAHLPLDHGRGSRTIKGYVRTGR